MKEGDRQRERQTDRERQSKRHRERQRQREKVVLLSMISVAPTLFPSGPLASQRVVVLQEEGPMRMRRWRFLVIA